MSWRCNGFHYLLSCWCEIVNIVPLWWKFISLRANIPWQVCSPDLSGCDYISWGFLSVQVFKRKTQTTDEQKDFISHEIVAITDAKNRKELDSNLYFILSYNLLMCMSSMKMLLHMLISIYLSIYLSWLISIYRYIFHSLFISIIVCTYLSLLVGSSLSIYLS